MDRLRTLGDLIAAEGLASTTRFALAAIKEADGVPARRGALLGLQTPPIDLVLLFRSFGRSLANAAGPETGPLPLLACLGLVLGLPPDQRLALLDEVRALVAEFPADLDALFSSDRVQVLTFRDDAGPDPAQRGAATAGAPLRLDVS